eukprot:9318170-Pyramimonas_sp.AAC.1
MTPALQREHESFEVPEARRNTILRTSMPDSCVLAIMKRTRTSFLVLRHRESIVAVRCSP